MTTHNQTQTQVDQKTSIRRVALSPRLLLTVAVVLSLSAAVRADEPAKKFHVVGYLPEWRAANLSADLGTNVTDLIYFSAEPTAEGGLNLRGIKPKTIEALRAIKKKNGVALFLCVGGWSRSAGFASTAASAAARERFATEATKFCVDNQFDGVDLDWEHPKDKTEEQNYGALIAATKKSFAPHGFQVTAAVAGWQKLSPEAVAGLDRVNLMAYDGDGRHSTYEMAVADVDKLAKLGVPASKICLGMPIYGRGVKDRKREMGYSEIVRKYQPAVDADEVDGLYFNGAATIDRKTRYAVKTGLAGVMVWEVGQDTDDDRSLLRAIRKALD